VSHKYIAAVAASVAERHAKKAAASTPAVKAAAKGKKQKAAAAAAAAAAPGNSKLDAFLSKRKGLNSSKAAHTPSQAQLQAQQQQLEQQRLLERQLKKQFMSSKVGCAALRCTLACLHASQPSRNMICRSVV
jgi:hypothetical protein